MKDVIKVIVSVVLLSIAAQVSFSLPENITTIPFTLQSLILFIIASFLRPRIFFAFILLYLLLGILGLPVFAEAGAGLDSILGNSGGFLYGFVFSGYFISSYFKTNQEVKLISCVNIMIQATLVLFFFGLIHLAILKGFSVAVNYGFLPFWKMALLKALLAAVIVYGIMNYSQRIVDSFKGDKTDK